MLAPLWLRCNKLVHLSAIHETFDTPERWRARCLIVARLENGVCNYA
jgi:hypothetical protein